ncbi:phasin family protein [Falsiroseomonas sp.]|uniref:phasin family protein n=1 Tax=Falsiroseomonas sp. TaxID=2870721 RepID=UPI00271D3AAE|nr:phasin family protein [Falsiroseomonas sp.]MDO9499257.1 phasin family protein [Falsiroseomonas sp.]
MAAEHKTEAKRSIALVETAAQAATDNATKTATQAAKGAEAGAAAAKKMMEDGASQARVKMEQGMQQMTKTTEGFYKAAEEAAEFGRGNLEAMTRATQTLTSGMQELSKQYFAMSQAMGEHAMESAKALSGVKSLKEAADIQAAFAKASMERTMAETAKLQEAAYRLAEQAGAPLAARMTLAVEKFSKPLAA